MKHNYDTFDPEEPPVKKYNPDNPQDLIHFINNYRGTRILKAGQKFGFDQESIKKHLKYANQRLGK